MRNLSSNVRRNSAGQALVEFLVAGIFFLVPLFLAISIMGKFSDVQHTAENAARYSAWERTIWYENNGSAFNTKNGPNTKSSAEIRNEVAARILNDRSSSSVIKSTDKSATGFINGLDPMWKDPSGDVYLQNYAQLDSAVTMTTASKDTALAIASASYGTDQLDIPSNNLASASVEFKTVAKDSGTYKRLWKSPAWAGLDFSAKGFILSNTWAANGSAGTLEMVTGLVSTRNPKNPMGPTLNNGYRAPLVAWDPGVLSMEVGKVGVDVIPSDRLN